MEKTVKFKRREPNTLTSLFKGLEPGDVLHVLDGDRTKHSSLRNIASALNKESRLTKEIKKDQIKFRVLVTLKKGHTSIKYIDNSKE